MLRVVFLLAFAMMSATPAQAGEELFQRLGGMEKIERFVGRTIDLSVADERIAASFGNTNLVRLKKLLTDQICQVSGGPCIYKGRDMRKSHAHLKITSYHFNALVENLQAAMDEENVPFAVQNELLAVLAPMHRDITAAPAATTAAPESR
jgi:hemoglobin